MEMQVDPAALREKYSRAMEQFTYTGKEPEAKERLRYLFHSQRVSFSSIAPEWENWRTWAEACIEEEDWPGLCRVLSQWDKLLMLPCIYGSYTHEKNVHCALECLVTGDVLAIERLLPPELAKVKDSYTPFFPVAAHLMLGLWYKDAAVLEWAVPEAEALLGTKKVNQMERAMLSFLLDIASGDMVKGSEDLLAVCKAFGRDKRYVLGARPFCTYAHGLCCLAQLLLPEEVFDKLELPDYKSFLPAFALWRRENHHPNRSLWYHYPEDLDIFNQIYTAPPARLALFQPLLDNTSVKPRVRQHWMAHGVKWVDNYVDEFWNMGIGRG